MIRRISIGGVAKIGRVYRDRQCRMPVVRLSGVLRTKGDNSETVTMNPVKYEI
jgi:hypothetical protein